MRRRFAIPGPWFVRRASSAGLPHGAQVHDPPARLRFPAPKTGGEALDVVSVFPHDAVLDPHSSSMISSDISQASHEFPWGVQISQNMPLPFDWNKCTASISPIGQYIKDLRLGQFTFLCPKKFGQRSQIVEPELSLCRQEQFVAGYRHYQTRNLHGTTGIVNRSDTKSEILINKNGRVVVTREGNAMGQIS